MIVITVLVVFFVCFFKQSKGLKFVILIILYILYILMANKSYEVQDCVFMISVTLGRQKSAQMLYVVITFLNHSAIS